MRDELPKLAEMMEYIESITEKERTKTPTIYHVVNIWKSATNFPQSIVSLLGSDLFVWTDKAEWNNETHVCRWIIELHHFHDSIKCQGMTIFEPALGGNGTKITFSGDLEWDSQKLAFITGAIGETVLVMAGDIIRNKIEKNFRKVAETIAKYLDKK